MKILSFFNKLYIKIQSKLIVASNHNWEKRLIKEKAKYFASLNEKELSEIDRFYKKYYGKKIPYYWHQYYANSRKTFDVKFFPELLFIPDVERLFNNPQYAKTLGDKNIFSLILKGLDFVQTPKTIINCSNSIAIDSNFNLLKFDDLYSYLKDYKYVFIKPSINSDSGKNVLKINMDLINKKQLYSLLDVYKGNFIIQENVVCHSDISALCPFACCSFRIITYILKGKVYHCPIVLKLATGNSYLDNTSMGSIFVPVSDDGTIINTGLDSKFNVYEVHPDSNIHLKGYKISHVDKMIKAVEKLQLAFANVGIISWDATINSNGDVVIIEANTCNGSIWFPQLCHGSSAFSDNTEEILTLLRKNDKLY